MYTFYLPHLYPKKKKKKVNHDYSYQNFLFGKNIRRQTKPEFYHSHNVKTLTRYVT